MSLGSSGTYAINNTDLPTPPSTGRWMPRDFLGFDGNGHPDYVGVREFEMTWELISLEDAQQLQTFFDSLGVTGTAIVDLPKYRTPWTFTSYTGCTLSEPEMDVFFEKHEVSVTLLIHRIVTG